jgi:hypothetical protein
VDRADHDRQVTCSCPDCTLTSVDLEEDTLLFLHNTIYILVCTSRRASLVQYLALKKSSVQNIFQTMIVEATRSFSLYEPAARNRVPSVQLGQHARIPARNSS